MKSRAISVFGATESGIENTTRAAASSHPTVGYVMRMPGAIEASEARGQAQFVASQSLPTDVRDRKAFEALGFTFGKPFADDPLFAPATLPAGWTKRSTDHDMHSEILDEKGRVRAGVFYKAAFYDRKADMSLRGRYRVNTEYNKDYTSVYTVVLDGKKEIHRTETFAGTKHEVFAAYDKQGAAACAWMDANRPDWQDPIKQWEAE